MGEISESFEYGLNAAATEYDGKHKYIRITDIDDSTHLFIQDNLTSPDIDFSTADDYLLQAGDVLFARTGASVGKTYIYRSSDGDLYFAGFLIRAKIKRDYDADFVFQNTLTDNYDSYIRITSQRSGQPGVNAQEYANFALSVPCLAEQKKIGAYFTNLDNLITLHQRECFSFDFSGESAKTAQKTISWEQRKLGEISESFEYGLNAAATEYDGKHKYIRITDIDDSTHLFIQDNLTSPDIDFSTADDYLLQAGDVLFARTGASVGKTYIYRSSDGDLYFAGFLIRAKIKRDYDADFVFQNTLTDNYDSYIRITSQRSGQPGVNAQEYANFALSVPCLAEQKKIGAYFTNLDNLITLHQHKPNKKGHDVLSVMPFKGNQRKPHYLCT